MNRPIVVATLASLLGGCSTPIYVRDAANALLGKTEEEVIAAFGRHYTTALPEDPRITGGKLMIYSFIPSQEAWMWGNLAFDVGAPCTVIFALEAGVVRYSTLRGDTCR